jgi:sigma-B regulation protein RsbU (phosphoserine phosphatase)
MKAYSSSLDAETLLRELANRRSEVEALQEVVRLLAPAHPRDTALLIAVASILRARFGVKRLAYLHTFTPERKPKLTYFHNFTSISRDALEEAIQATSTYFPPPESLLARMGVEVVMPLGRYVGPSVRIHKVEPKAWWLLGDFAESDEEEASDLIYLEVIGTLITVFLENNYIHEQQLASERLRLERQALERELEFASRLQRRFALKSVSLHPRLETLLHYDARQKVGGDLADFIKTAEGDVFFYIGDVAGKGISAALVMANLHGQIQTLAELRTDLPTIMDLLHRRISQIYGEEAGFVTLFLGHIDFSGGAPLLRYLNAGHPAPILIRGGERLLLEANQTILGIDLPGRPSFLEVQPAAIPLQSGDALVAYTDGLIEQPNPDGHQLGMERLIVALQALTDATASQMLKALQVLLETHRGEQPLEDDLTILLWQLR